VAAHQKYAHSIFPLSSLTFRIRILRSLLTLIMTAAFSLPLAAAPPEPLIRGTVLDSSGARIAGARVSAVHQGTGQALSTHSGQDGGFDLWSPPGSYIVTVVANGFAPTSQPVTVAANAVISLEIHLQVSPSRAVITVTEPSDYGPQRTSSATKTPTLLLNVPQSVSVVSRDLIRDQDMLSIADVVRYTPGITAHQGENNRDQVVIRGNSSSADFFVDGVRDDVQYYRDLYNVERVEALKGPNAMIFGRGGGGGVINRVTKEAGFMPVREVVFQGGGYDSKRFTTDLDQPFGSKAALRLNGVYENSGSFRKFVDLERYGVNPTLTLLPGKQTDVKLSFENFHDYRVADRGIPSFQGLPAGLPIDTYFGNPDNSRVRARVDLGSATVEHHMGGLGIRNHTLVGDYDRGYQNYVPGAVDALQMQDSLSAYNNATHRRNLFNQTDMSYLLKTRSIRHRLLWGAELGRQLTDNFRNTGYFNNSTTSIAVPYAAPTIDTPIFFRQSATDANNHITTNVAAAYVQDQAELSRYVQVTGGLRLDRFDLEYHDNRTGGNLGRIDHMLSPRAGIVVKPLTSVSLYASYGVSYLPSSGDQFSRLTDVTQQIKPEKFINHEAGLKWDVTHRLAVTLAAYRLDRTNTRAPDPNDPSRIVQTGGQRTNGYELEVKGSVTHTWKIAGGYAYQDAFVTSATTSAPAGAHVALTPQHSFSLWNNYRVLRRLGAGLGIIHQTDMYAAIDDSVVLPAFTRLDVAMYLTLTERVGLQMNLENLLNRTYYATADGNNNISPGSPRVVRIGMNARF
jgi:catecholate siderophore receptor